MTAWSFDARIVLAKGGIEAEQAQRQERTARAILDRLQAQAGVVLADEVGMGKTFVALAVAASVARTSKQPVVVMCPPRLVDKWKRDAARFVQRCLGGDGAPTFARVAETGAAFLKCFDDPDDRRCSLVILPNTALHRTERDPWVKLSVIKRALSHINADAMRVRAVARYAREILRSSELAGLDEDSFATLLDKRIDGWRSYLESVGCHLDDDPVPHAFYQAIKARHLTAVGEALLSVPVRVSDSLEQRLTDARRAIDAAIKELWPEALHTAQIRSPLLIVDEAHHLKNDDTRLAGLFSKDADESVLAQTFDRMVFLTATPFQLGHRELLGVLSRFQAVRWETLGGDAASAKFHQALGELDDALDNAQQCSLVLDKRWGKVTARDVPLDAQGEVTDDTWQQWMVIPQPGGALGSALQQYSVARGALRSAERLLAPWVVRNLRERTMSAETGVVARRINVTGRGIVDGEQTTQGIPLVGDARFPFLLCARAQGLLSRVSGARAYFAEGLASSYGAFMDTAKPTDDADVDLSDNDEHGEVAWYLKQVRGLLGEQRAAADHPKLAATVECAMHHWREGHKVLVFAHYRRTIADLTQVLNVRIGQEVIRFGARKLGLDANDTARVREQLDRIAGRLANADSPMHQEVRAVLSRWVAEANLDANVSGAVVDQLLATLRSDSFLVRHLPLDRREVRESLASERPTTAQSRAAADAVGDSLSRRHGSASYRERVRRFLDHLREDLGDAKEQASLLEDLRGARLTPIEHADGGVGEETRRKRLRGFNSPLMPEILVASEVMAEGLDLHLDCRHIIHHDLSWNPSTLEQRTGRVDRLRCKAELDQQSIQVYLPYLAGTADEKMYRVVTDRARWFQIVMGEKYAVDEHTTEKLTQRIPFPEAAARDLMFSLEVRE